MNRKPQVFIDGRNTTEHLFQERYNHLYEMGEINDFKNFVEKDEILIDGDIFLGISENRLYYKKEFIISSKDGEFFEYINFVSIPKNISESFDNLIDVFGNAAIVCSKLNIELRLEFHKSDKTFLEIAQEFGSNKIQYVGIIDNQLVVELKNFSQKLKVSINHENKIEYLKKIYQLSLEPRISIFFLCGDEFLRKTDNDFEESEKSIIENINFL